MIFETPTLRNIYRVIAIQYDPLGLLLPYTTRAKVIIKYLWNKQRGWDDPNLPPDLLHSWMQWEEELCCLPSVSFPLPYVPSAVGIEGVTREVHIFSDASVQAYGAVAYLRTVDPAGQTYLSFLIARSRVTPKRVHYYSPIGDLWELSRSPASEVAGRQVDCAYPFYCAVDRFYYGPSVAEVRVLPSPSLCWQ